MKIRLDNVNLFSSSGPNSFAVKISALLKHRSHEIVDSGEDVQLSFISVERHTAPTLLRLDGVWFNTQQDYVTLNAPIKYSYLNVADAVIVQSEFDQELVENFFGKRENVSIVHNCANVSEISKIEPFVLPFMRKFSKIWMCASDWRPHKRLRQNIDYFLENSSQEECMIVVGRGADVYNGFVRHDRVYNLGHVTRHEVISLMKSSQVFVHLAYLDHCPNVVVDARACGCQIVCASSGGTREIAGKDAVVVRDVDFDFKPTKLYEPPTLDFSVILNNRDHEEQSDECCVMAYERLLLTATEIAKGRK